VWLLLASAPLAIFAAACGSPDQDATPRIPRLTIFEPGPEPLKRGKNNIDFNTNGEALAIRTLIDPHDTVFDVGAFLGDWSRVVSTHQPTARVYAFEPAPDSYPKLEENIRNTQITPVKLALSDSAGVMTFRVYPQGEILNSFYERKKLTEAGVTPELVEVATERLDAWCKGKGIDHIDYLKIDTEGAELLIMRGASEMLKDKSIALVQFEYGGTYPDAGITLRQVYDLLTEYGYEIYRILPDGLLHIPAWDDVHEDYAFANFLAAANPGVAGRKP
jgi:FkbM family methyltransferase